MFGKILLAVDDTRGAGFATGAVRDLAKATGDQVLVVHVREFITGGRTGSYSYESTEQASAFLERTLEQLRCAGVDARAEIRTAVAGRTGKELVEAAQEHGAGLVAIGSHSAGELRALVLGSVAHDVVHHAHCPVLLVPEPLAPRDDVDSLSATGASTA
jgi:nucleotide-binding universal stress UspA family protein